MAIKYNTIINKYITEDKYAQIPRCSPFNKITFTFQKQKCFLYKTEQNNKIFG